VTDPERVVLEAWYGPWPDDDPDANFKADVALYSLVDPLPTLRRLGENIGVPVGALVRYVLARWATGGSEGVLELGPSTVTRMHQAFEDAEAEGTDEARRAAYDQVRQMVAWLRVPLDQPEVYEGGAGEP